MAFVSATTTRTNLLVLPYEIRNLIYSAVLEDDQKPPVSPLELSGTDCMFPFWLIHSSYIHKPPPPTTTCHGLLGSCRQIRWEVTQKLELRKARGDLKYKMDCMILRNGEIFPSWTWIPAPHRFLSTFEINVRILTVDAIGGSVAKSRRGVLDDPGFKVVDLIDEFFNRGPAYQPVKIIRNDIQVQSVIINIVPPPEVSEEALESPATRLPDGSMHPVSLFGSIRSCLPPRLLQNATNVLSLHYKDMSHDWHACDYDPSNLSGLHKRKAKRRPQRQQRVDRPYQVPVRRSTRARAQHPDHLGTGNSNG